MRGAVGQTCKVWYFEVSIFWENNTERQLRYMPGGGTEEHKGGGYRSGQTFRPFRALLTSSVSLPVIMAKRQDPNKRNHQT